ncbi:MAG: hypothetical protein AAF669_04485 [Pseudomonadota bacterium]
MSQVSMQEYIMLPVSEYGESGIYTSNKTQGMPHDNSLSLSRQEVGTAAGCLRGIVSDQSVSDEQSRQSHFV